MNPDTSSRDTGSGSRRVRHARQDDHRPGSCVEDVLWSELTNFFPDELDLGRVRGLLGKQTNWSYFVCKVLREKSGRLNCASAKKLGIFDDLPEEIQTILSGEYVLRDQSGTRLSAERELLKLPEVVGFTHGSRVFFIVNKMNINKMNARAPRKGDSVIRP